MITEEIIKEILNSMFPNYGYEFIIEDWDKDDAFFQFRIKEIDKEEKEFPNKSISIHIVLTDYYELKLLNKASDDYDDLGYYHDCGEFTPVSNFWELLFNEMLD